MRKFIAKLIGFGVLLVSYSLSLAQSTNKTDLYVNTPLYVETNFNNSTGGTIHNQNTIHAKGNWGNTGTQAVDGMVIFEGSALQNITGSTSFYDTQLNNSAGAQISSGGMQYVRDVMDLLTGNLKTNNNLTLVSTASLTSQISGLGTGSVTDQIIAERYIPNTWQGVVMWESGYHYLSSPVTDANFSDYSDDVVPWILYDWPGGGTASTYGRFYLYNETTPAGTAPAGAGDPPNYYGKWDAPSSIEIGRGYAAHMTYTNPYVMEVDGHYTHTASPSYNLTYTAGVPNYGWNLIGNPYPSGLDWDAPSGWTKNNVNNAIYFWNPSTMSYASYISGVGTNGGTRYIAPQQGFFVRANSTGASVGFSNPARTVQNATFFKNNNDASIVRLELNYNTSKDLPDETVVRIDGASTEDYDVDLDAYKLKSPNYMRPELYSIYKGKEYAINSLPLLESNVVIPLGVKIGESGTYRIKAKELTNLPSNTSVVLVDKAKKYKQDLKANPSYTIPLESGVYTDRFYLNLTMGEEDNIAVPNDFYLYDDNGSIVVQWQNPLGERTEVAVFDAVGQELNRVSVTEGLDKVKIPVNIATGYYFVQVVKKDNTTSKPIFIR